MSRKYTQTLTAIFRGAPNEQSAIAAIAAAKTRYAATAAAKTGKFQCATDGKTTGVFCTSNSDDSAACNAKSGWTPSSCAAALANRA
ncbi:MAG: hypothetical protein WA949_19920 [Phormidesmis sp.]